MSVKVVLVKGGAEKTVDVTVQDDRFCTLLDAIGALYPRWRYYETIG